VYNKICFLVSLYECFFFLSPTGVLLHDLIEIRKRQLSGKKRQEALEILKVTKPSIHRRKRYGDTKTDKEALGLGNMTAVQNLRVLSKARQEVVSTIHTSTFTELLILYCITTL